MRRFSGADDTHATGIQRAVPEPLHRNPVHAQRSKLASPAAGTVPVPPMKTFQAPSLATVVLAGLAFSLSLATASAKDSRARQPRLYSMFAGENRQELATNALAEAPDAWQNIQYFPYEKRQEFNAVFTRMVAKLDDDIRDLNAKRATMKNDTTEWDFAMKELNNARADVQSKVSELSRTTTADTWAEARDRLGVAWDRALTAVRAVRNSTTS